MYLNVGCVCESVCVWVTEAGRDLFMHNKLISLIIEEVWYLFAFIVGSLSVTLTFRAPKKVHLRAMPKSGFRTQMEPRTAHLSQSGQFGTKCQRFHRAVEVSPAVPADIQR